MSILSVQLANYDMSDGFSGVRKKLFQYDEVVDGGIDRATRANTQYGLTTRAIGAIQTAGGVVITTGSTLGAMGACVGIGGTSCIVAVPAGAVGAAYGSDLAASGIKAVYTGKYHSPIGSQALAALTGISQDTADLIYGAPSGLFGIKPLASGVTRVGQTVAKEVTQVGVETKYVIGELGKDIKAAGSYIDDATTRVGVNIQNSQVLTNINNAIPKEYKIAFGIEATTGAMVESLYYLDGSKEVNLPNLINSGYKLIVDSSYGAVVHKLNPVYGVGMDVVKGGILDEKNINNSIVDSVRSNSISVTGSYLGYKAKLPENNIRIISSGVIKYLDYQVEKNKLEGNRDD